MLRRMFASNCYLIYEYIVLVLLILCMRRPVLTLYVDIGTALNLNIRRQPITTLKKLQSAVRRAYMQANSKLCRLRQGERNSGRD